jgi:diguanylate cyclase (GGDEF)-like protein
VYAAKATARDPGQTGQTGQKVGFDEATGVWNRAGFVAAATPLYVSCQRRDAPSALAYFDFHAPDSARTASDDAMIERVLAAMAQEMRKAFRACDIIGRIDTFRFAVLFADSTDETLAAVEGVRAVADQSTSVNGRTLTVGTITSSPGETLEHLMLSADARMQEIKRAPTGV